MHASINSPARPRTRQTQELLQRKERDLALREAKIEKITFELARLKRWKYAAKSEAMNAEQRRTVRGDPGRGRGELARAAGAVAPASGCADGANNKPKAPPRRPRREALPEHLRVWSTATNREAPTAGARLRHVR
jgi:hypothetical protein